MGQDWWDVNTDTKHLSCTQARDEYGRKIWESYTKFSVVRNPFDRLVSMYASLFWHAPSKLHPRCSLYEFIRGVSPMGIEGGSTHQAKVINLDVDFLLRFEHLESDLNEMLAVLGHDPVDLPHVQRCSRQNVKDRTKIGEIERNLIKQVYADDIALWESICSPSEQAAAQDDLQRRACSDTG